MYKVIRECVTVVPNLVPGVRKGFSGDLWIMLLNV